MKFFSKISLFYVLALLISIPGTLGYSKAWFNGYNLPFGLDIFFNLTQGLGPFLAALIGFYLFRKSHTRAITVFGGSYKKSLLMLALPLIVWTVLGQPNEQGLNPHYYGFLVGVLMLTHAFMEELGWRGYLYDTLRPLNEITSSLLLGTLWYVWHLGFLHASDWMDQLLFWALCCAGSYGLGKLADATKSVIVAACFHSVFNMMQWVQAEPVYKLTGIGLITLAWIVIVKRWDKEMKAEEAGRQQVEGEPSVQDEKLYSLKDE